MEIHRLRPGHYITGDRRHVIRRAGGGWQLAPNPLAGAPQWTATLRTLRDAKAYLREGPN
jgi:hypothetical protein